MMLVLRMLIDTMAGHCGLYLAHVILRWRWQRDKLHRRLLVAIGSVISLPSRVRYAPQITPSGEVCG